MEIRIEHLSMQYGMWWSIVLHTMGSCHSVMEKH